MTNLERMAEDAVEFMQRHKSYFKKIRGHQDEVESQFLYIVATAKAVADRWPMMEETEKIKTLYRMANCSIKKVFRSMSRDHLVPVDDEYFKTIMNEDNQYSVVDWRLSIEAEIDIFYKSNREAVLEILSGGDRPDELYVRQRIKNSMKNNMHRFQ